MCQRLFFNKFAGLFYRTAPDDCFFVDLHVSFYGFWMEHIDSVLAKCSKLLLENVV